MKLKIRVTNSSNKNILIMFEPSGDYQYLSNHEEINLELDKRNEGSPVDIIIDDESRIIFVENNEIFINKLNS